MLTIAEIAKRYDLPESTARFYCKRFREFLPHVGQGKRRRYLPEALPVFEAILEEMAQSKNASMVVTRLEKKYPRASPARAASRTDAEEFRQQRPFLEQDHSLERVEQLFQKQTEVLERIAGLLDSLARGQAATTEPPPAGATTRANENMNARLHAVEDSVADLREETRSLRSIQDQAERIQQQDLEQLRKWLAHLAKEQARERENT